MKIKTHVFIAFLFCLVGATSFAQVTDSNGTVLFGNEWIDYDKSYVAIKVAEDGVYRVSKATLENSNFPIESEQMSGFAMYRMGQQIPIRTTSEGLMNDGDFIEFIGKKNRTELDKHLYSDLTKLVDPYNSIISDTITYYLTYGVSNPLRMDIVETTITGNEPEAESHFIDERVHTFPSGNLLTYSKNSVFSSEFVNFSGVSSGMKPKIAVNKFDTDNIYENAGNPSIEFQLFTNTTNVDFEIKLNGNLINQQVLPQYSSFKDSFAFDINFLENTNQFIFEGVEDNNRFALGYFKVQYPREFDFSDQNKNAQLFLDENPNERYVEITNFSNADEVYIYNESEGIQFIPFIQNDTVKWKVPPINEKNQYRIISASEIIQVGNVTSKQFTDFANLESPNLVMISHPKLAYDSITGVNPIQEYIDYRSSFQGGSYSPYLIDIYELYDQFSYGVPYHPFSVKNFINYIGDYWTDISHVYLVGKAIEYRLSRWDEDRIQRNLIPTYGMPASDNLLMSEFGEIVPSIPVGRIAAETGHEVSIYLDKVKKYEANIDEAHTIQNKQWMKEFMHLAGGYFNYEISTINASLNNMKTEIEQGPLGGKVFTFTKNPVEPLSNSNAELITSRINNGLAVVTFFGHSAPGTYDLSIEKPEDFENSPRFPILMSLGCYTGNIHLNSYALSVDFVMTEDRGMVAFVGSSWQAFISNLAVFGKEFYKSYGSSEYGTTLGEINRTTLISSGFIDQFTQMQSTLHGDPCLRIHSFEGPDYIIDNESIATNPNVVDAVDESFDVCFDIINLGSNIDEDMKIQIQHYSVQDDILIDSLISVETPSFSQNYCVTLPLHNKDIIGKNKIKITLDIDQQIEEFPMPVAENNNTISTPENTDYFEFYIFSSQAIPVMPKDYAIISDEDVELVAFTSNAFSQPLDYYIEIDTTATFNSPLLRSTTIAQTNGTISWNPSIPMISNQEYYWRIQSSETGLGNQIWAESTFLYLDGSQIGFNQSETTQFDENQYDKISIEETGIEFIPDIIDYRIYNGVYISGEEPHFYINGGFWNPAFQFNKKASIGVTVIDTFGRMNFLNEYDGIYGSENYNTNATHSSFYFDPADSLSRVACVNFLKDTIPDGYYVFFYTKNRKVTDDFDTESWANDSISNDGWNLYNYLETQGANQLNYFRDSANTIVPYTFIYKKNDFSMAEGRAENIDEFIDHSVTIQGRWFEGSMSSQKIGPSTNWKSAEWQYLENDFGQNDTLQIDLYGYNLDNEKILLVENMEPGAFDLSAIDADTMPYMSFDYYSKDVYDLSAVDLDYWRIYFDGVPELGIVTNESFEFYKDTIDVGDEFYIKIPVQNLSQHAILDSVEVQFVFTSESNEKFIYTKKLPPFAEGEIQYVELNQSTLNFANNYSISVQVNPQEIPMECTYENNYGYKEFFVQKDIKNPVLDVTFDGRHILDGDLVASQPYIQISVKDENQYLLLNDTSAYNIKLLTPSNQSIDINFDQPDIQFIPADSGENNSAIINYNPALAEDGKYRLSVMAKDRSDNHSGDFDYEIYFEVIQKSMASNVFNYPNPFSTSTQFVFTLTGNELPENFKIQIMTVSGKVVKEIYKHELGPLHIGVNRTQYKWDGTDDFGSPLANGVYLYRIRMEKSDGSAFEKYDTNTDQYFKENIGKMVIMR